MRFLAQFRTEVQTGPGWAPFPVTKNLYDEAAERAVAVVRLLGLALASVTRR